MDGEGECDKLRTVENVFMDFERRRAGIIKALTTDFQKFRGKCNPEEEKLCLYGHTNEQWEVKEPADEVPPDLPEPVVGINIAPDAMPEKEMIALVAAHSDSWLLSVAYYFGANFDRDDRQRLFNMINELPTIYEVVTGKTKTHTEEKPNVSNNSGSKRKSNSREEESDEEDEEEEEDDELCGACGKKDGRVKFWIRCDYCSVWYHGKCLKITPTKAKSIGLYTCPSCSCSRVS